MLVVTHFTNKKMYTFLDDTLTLNRDFTARLMRQIINSNLNIAFEGHTRANLVDEELMKLMKKAGLKELIFGVESGSERVRNEVIGKGVTDKAIENAVKLCKKHNILADMYLMLGFPTETKEEVEQTVNYPAHIKPNIFGLHITIPLPGARIWDIALSEGVIPKDTVDQYIKGNFGDDFNEAWPFYNNKEVSLKALKEAQKRAYRKYYLTPSYIWHRMKTDARNLDALKKDFNQALSLVKSGHAKYLE
jgi:anaerobic magnesium-protoporphyrin IX monomethyl ester cyclase